MFQLTEMELGGSNPAGNATISEGLSEPMPYPQLQGLGVLLQEAPTCASTDGERAVSPNIPSSLEFELLNTALPAPLPAKALDKEPIIGSTHQQ